MKIFLDHWFWTHADATKPLLIQSHLQMNHLLMSLQVPKRTTVSRKDRLSLYLSLAVPRPRLLTVYSGRHRSLALRPRVLLYLCSHHLHQARDVDGFVFPRYFLLFWILQHDYREIFKVAVSWCLFSWMSVRDQDLLHHAPYPCVCVKHRFLVSEQGTATDSLAAEEIYLSVIWFVFHVMYNSFLLFWLFPRYRDKSALKTSQLVSKQWNSCTFVLFLNVHQNSRSDILALNLLSTRLFYSHTNGTQHAKKSFANIITFDSNSVSDMPTLKLTIAWPRLGERSCCIEWNLLLPT